MCHLVLSTHVKGLLVPFYHDEDAWILAPKSRDAVTAEMGNVCHPIMPEFLGFTVVVIKEKERE